MSSFRINRRAFLAGAAATTALSACGGGTAATASTEPQRLGVRFPDGFRAPSVAVAQTRQRFPFAVIANDGFPMTSGAPDEITMEVFFNSEMIEQQTVAARGAGQLIPYYPLSFTPEVAGTYIIRTEFADIDTELAVVERSDTPLFQVGDTLPGFATPTAADSAGVASICTRAEPCPFHEVSLDDALTNGKPTAMLIATPAFCQTDVCGPNVEWLIELAGSRDDINVIHAEVYEDFQRDVDAGGLPTRAPMLEAWDIAFEPSLFVTDANGIIVDALHFAFDSDEMADSLSLI